MLYKPLKNTSIIILSIIIFSCSSSHKINIADTNNYIQQPIITSPSLAPVKITASILPKNDTVVPIDNVLDETNNDTIDSKVPNITISSSSQLFNNTPVLSQAYIENEFKEAQIRSNIKVSDYTTVTNIQKTADNKGYKKTFKNKNDEGAIVYKTGANNAYWIHGNIYKKFIKSGGIIDDLGYPITDENKPLPEEKISLDVIKQNFEGGVIYLINDKDRQDIYADNTVVKTLKEMNFSTENNYSFSNYEFPTYSEKSTGRRGDPVNMIFVAKNQQQIEKSFDDAGWSKPKLGLSNLPVSELQAFGRKQDLAFVNDTSSVLTLYSHRNHIRLWKSEFKEGDNEIWIGGATEDIAVKKKDKMLRKEEKANSSPDKSNPFTHVVDPDTDRERDYVGKSIQESDPNVSLVYLKTKNTNLISLPIETLNGGLDLVIWDSRLLVVNISK